MLARQQRDSTVERLQDTYLKGVIVNNEVEA